MNSVENVNTNANTVPVHNSPGHQPGQGQGDWNDVNRKNQGKLPMGKQRFHLEEVMKP